MAARPKVTPPRRGEVYLVRLDPTTGHEIKKTRPAVVVQNDFSNRTSPTTVVAPVTSRSRVQIYPTEVLVHAPEGGLTVDSLILFRQLRAVDRTRLVRRMGTLRPATMAALDRALMITLRLIEL